MNISWLEDFLALIGSGSFSRAAEERHMTQPAFSRRIRALEEWLGTALFDRSSHPIRLTASGEWLRDRAQDLTARLSRMPGEARAVADAHAAGLRFAATHALSFTFLPLWLRGLEARTNVGPITLVSDVFAHCEALLLQSRVQFLLTHAHPRAPSELVAQNYPFVVVGDDLLIPVSAPGPAGGPRFEISNASSASPLRILTYSAESGIGRILQEIHGAALERLSLQTAFQAHLASVLRTMALDGRGIAWLPQTLIAEDLARGDLVAAAPADWCIEMQIRLYRDRSPMGTAAEKFWGAVGSTAPDSGADGR